MQGDSNFTVTRTVTRTVINQIIDNLSYITKKVTDDSKIHLCFNGHSITMQHKQNLPRGDDPAYPYPYQMDGPAWEMGDVRFIDRDYYMDMIDTYALNIAEPINISCKP